MDYLITGDSKEVSKVLQENRIRVERGLIKFTPCSTVDVDGKEMLILDTKDAPCCTDEKKPKCKKKKAD